jgi:hypothetical protein
MRIFVHASIVVLAMVNVAEADEKFDPTTCGAVKGAVEQFLTLADASFKEAEKLRQSANMKAADVNFKEAISMSELAENYSAVYTAVELGETPTQ